MYIKILKFRSFNDLSNSVEIYLYASSEMITSVELCAEGRISSLAIVFFILYFINDMLPATSYKTPNVHFIIFFGEGIEGFFAKN